MKHSMRFLNGLVSLVVLSSMVFGLLSPVANAESFEYIWPTPELAADPNAYASTQWISSNGRYVAERTSESNGSNPQSWLVDRSDGSSQLLDGDIFELSNDTRYMLFGRTVHFLGSFETHWLRDRVASSEVQIDGNPNDPNFNPGTIDPVQGQRNLSDDGTVAIFISGHYNLVLPGAPNNTFHLYSYDANSQTHALIDDPSQGEVVSAALSGDGRYILYIQRHATDPDSAILYDRQTETGQLVGNPTACRGNSVRINYDGSVIAFTCRDGSKVIDRATSEERNLYDNQNLMTSMSDDGKVFTSTNGHVYSWETNTLLPVLQSNAVQTPLISGDASVIVGVLSRPANPPDVPSETFAPIVTATPSFVVEDTTPPTIEPVVSPSPNAQGWNNVPANLSWNINDPESTVDSQSGCDQVTVSNTPGTTYTCSATSTGGTSSTSVTIKVDTVAPTLADITLNAPTNAGAAFTNSQVASDSLSGVHAISCSVANGAVLSVGVHSVNCTATDIAGNSTTGDITVTVIGPSQPALSFHSIGSNSRSSSGNASLTTSVTGNVTTGSTIMVSVATGTFSGTVGCSDSKGNSYAVIADKNTGNGRVFLCSAGVTTALASGDAVTATYPGFSGLSAMSISSVTGLDHPGSADVASTGSGSNGTVSAGTVVPSNTPAVIFGVVANGGTSVFTPDSPYTMLSQFTAGSGSGARTINVFYRVVTAAGSYTVGGSRSGSGFWQALAAVFLATGSHGGGGGGPA